MGTSNRPANAPAGAAILTSPIAIDSVPVGRTTPADPTASDGIDNADGKTFSRFELAKGLRQQIEALGGVRVSERSYDRDFYTANEKALDDFRQEFDDLQDAYWYDKDVDTYAIRRADGVVWVVLQTRNDEAAVLVAEGPAPALD